MRTRAIGKLVLAFGLAALMTAPARAQGFRGGGMGMGPGMLMMPAVQKELSLNDEQIEKVQSLVEDMGAKMRERFQDLQNVPQEERREKMQAMMREMNEETSKSLKEILKDEQMKRYHQIRLQASGLEAFNDPEVASKLKLSDEQKEKINGITEDMRGQMREIFQTAQDDREGAMKKMGELRRESMEKATALLSEDQKAAWKELTGKPFEMPLGPGRGPRPGPPS